MSLLFLYGQEQFELWWELLLTVETIGEVDTAHEEDMVHEGCRTCNGMSRLIFPHAHAYES